jgi:uncharacterized protein YcsI (UPF0317 family)
VIFDQPQDFRKACREKRFTDPSGGQTPGFEQANIVILPDAYADSFHRYCLLNPQPCPILHIAELGDPTMAPLGADIDIRHDLPRYRIFHHGEAARDVTDIEDIWRDDLVTFALGCSLSFEAALVSAGVNMRHVQEGIPCAAYRTERVTQTVDPFSAPLTVTMRVVPDDQVALATDISQRFPLSHGGPIHVGDPAELGIISLENNIDGIGLNKIGDDETAMFWACGVTAIEAAASSACDLMISHAPAHMLITDRRALKPT